MRVAFGSFAPVAPVRFGNNPATTDRLKAALTELENCGDRMFIGEISMVIAKQPQAFKDRLMAATDNLADFPNLKADYEQLTARRGDMSLPGNYGAQMMNDYRVRDDITGKVVGLLQRI